MKKLLLAGVLAASFAGPVASAAACTLETCVGTSVVCTRINCHICYIEPPGYYHCITR